ncbi:MAG: GntR family transcriptional regulator [Chloroflexi bacterium]|nr:GntR family transcriptional regulator [Chloroflexota bacterium]
MIEGLKRLGAVHMTLSERVYQELRQAVISQRLAPGSQLRSQDLAQALRVSRTPVKEALFRLRQEGLVSYTERQGFFVSTIATDGLLGLFDARSMCEIFAARKALPNVSEEALQTVSAAMDACRRSVEGQEQPTGWYDADHAFHHAIVALAGNQRILAWHAHLRTLTRFARLVGTPKRPPIDFDLAVREHQAIADGVMSRDVAAAEAAVRRHANNALARLMGYIPAAVNS